MGNSRTRKLHGGIEAVRNALSGALAPFAHAEPEARQKRRNRARDGLRVFAETYFPHHLTHSPSAMHLAFCSRFEAMVKEAEAEEAGTATPETRSTGNKMCQAAPRGNAKSTLASLIFPLWCIVGKRRRFIGLISDTTEQAAEFLEIIKAELEINERLREDFPEICGEGKVWQRGHVVTANGVKVKCWGKRKRIRGVRHGNRRPDLVICDDLEDDESIESPGQREKDRKWFFKALMKVGAKYTVYVVIGTVLHYDSLLARLLKAPGWAGKKWQAVLRWSDSPLWKQWEKVFADPGNPHAEQGADTFFAKHRAAMLAGTQTLWPEAEDYYYLMKMRVSDGPAYFDSEKQNEPINPNDCLFAEEWFRYWEDNATAPTTAEVGAGDRIYCAVDPSLGKLNRFGDPSAILIAVLRPTGHLDVLVADIRRRTPDVIMEDLFRYGERYRFERVAIESVQFQEMFKDEVTKASAQRGLYLPVEGVRPTSDKALRIAKLQPHIKNGLIRFRRDQQDLLQQLKYFPKADHDDGPDALEMVFSLINNRPIAPRIRTLG
jgi:predicted phage terminase large subunit-like protein